MTCTTPIIVAADVPDERSLLTLASLLDPELCRLKVGMEQFTGSGPQAVKKLQAMGFEVFLDLKFHDIPQTLENACRVASDLGVWMVNVHALGGRKMMEAARRGVGDLPDRPKLAAVTVLTSMDTGDLNEIGFRMEPYQLVQHLGKLAINCGVDALISSPKEVPLLKGKHPFDGVEFVTPGIRLLGGDKHDQKRVTTPHDAVSGGSDYIVVGRAITGTKNPAEGLQAVLSNLAQ